MFLNILDTNFLLLINVFYSEDVLWKERTKYYNFNQILRLLILSKMSIKLLVILFSIKEDIPSRKISFKNGDEDIEHFVEIKL